MFNGINKKYLWKNHNVKVKKISWVPSETVTDIIDTLLGTDDLTKEQQYMEYSKIKKVKNKIKTFWLITRAVFPSLIFLNEKQYFSKNLSELNVRETNQSLLKYLPHVLSYSTCLLLYMIFSLTCLDCYVLSCTSRLSYFRYFMLIITSSSYVS